MRRLGTIFGLIAALLAGAAIAADGPAGGSSPAAPSPGSAAADGAAPAKEAVATFAGGCFWCMQPPFDKTKGVIRTTAGYTGGDSPNPTYEDVSSGTTGHAESVEVIFDPSVVTYRQLLDIYWHNIDPLAKDRQFCDSGNQYRSAIFYHDDEQKKEAEDSKAALEASRRFKSPIQTQIVAAGPFYPAEDYHQEYYKKNPARYHFYRWGCGRDKRLRELWGADAPEEQHD